MDFFQAQEAARHKTKRLVVYYLLAVALILTGVYLAFVVALSYLDGNSGTDRYGEPNPPLPIVWWQPGLFAEVAIGTVLLIGGGTLFRTAALRQGGGAVARMCNGRRVSTDTTDPRERRLLNVVEEMAIAAGIRIPEVYVLDHESGINAFAAGYSPDDAAVTVTAGCLDQLSRDELQGVIGHEFSHVLNGDMRLNIRLIGLLFGILLIALAGEILFRTAGQAGLLGGGRRRNDKGNGAIVVIFLLGLALTVIGYIGVFFGRLIQSAVSRQREFLADASSVQFTRNPGGITGALKKIGGWEAGAKVQNPHAAELSHMFFANAMSGSAMNLFATHPPLRERIRAIDPSFDGTLQPVRAQTARPQPPAPATPPPAPRPSVMRPDSLIAGVGMLAQEQVNAAASLLNVIPAALRDAARNPRSARLVLYCLLLEPDEASRVKQFAALESELDTATLAMLKQVHTLTQQAGERARLPLLDLSLSALRGLSSNDKAALLARIDTLVMANGQVSLFEFTIQKVARRVLEPADGDRRPAPTQYYAIAGLVPEFILILSVVAHAGNEAEDAVRSAFAAGTARIDELGSQVQLLPARAINWPSVETALGKLDLASFPIKKRLLDACAHAVTADSRIAEAEMEILRAVGAALNCPVPPLTA